MGRLRVLKSTLGCGDVNGGMRVEVDLGGWTENRNGETIVNLISEKVYVDVGGMGWGRGSISFVS